MKKAIDSSYYSDIKLLISQGKLFERNRMEGGKNG